MHIPFQSLSATNDDRRFHEDTMLVTHNSEHHSTLGIIIMYIYQALINALSAHMIHINLNIIFYTHVEHSPTKTIYIKYYKKN